MAKTVEKILQLFKWRNVTCLNGGEKNNKGECRCQKYYTGPECQYIQCLYGGTVILPENKSCLCPDEYHYRGRHCETILCENGGKDNGQGGCDCLPDWYNGQFCQFYSSPWIILFSCLGLFITVIAFVCIACRLQNWFCSLSDITTFSDCCRNQSCHSQSHPLSVYSAQSVPTAYERRPLYSNKRFTFDREENVIPLPSTSSDTYIAVMPEYPETPPPSYEAALFTYVHAMAVKTAHETKNVIRILE
ncbi:hypothetical protein T02_14279, partial [Trichinella nativa]